MKQLLFCFLVSLPLVALAEFEEEQFYDEREQIVIENEVDSINGYDEESISFEEDEVGELEIDNQALTSLAE